MCLIQITLSKSKQIFRDHLVWSKQRNEKGHSKETTKYS